MNETYTKLFFRLHLRLVKSTPGPAELGGPGGPRPPQYFETIMGYRAIFMSERFRESVVVLRGLEIPRKIFRMFHQLFQNMLQNKVWN